MFAIAIHKCERVEVKYNYIQFREPDYTVGSLRQSDSSWK